MAKKRSKRRPWSEQEIRELQALARQKTHVRKIAN
jgi:hypothetical protein